MKKSFQILAIEDEPSDFAILCEMIRSDPDGGHPAVRHAVTLGEAERALRSQSFDSVVCDLNLPDSSGLSTVERILDITDSPLVVLTGTGENDLAEQAVRRGAQDYLEKDALTPARLWRSIRFARERSVLAAEWERVRNDREERRHLETIGRFSGGVAHDINNALAILKCYTDVLGEEGAAALPEALTHIREAGERVTKLVKRLMQVGGKEESPELEVLDLSNTVETLRLHLVQRLPAEVRVTFNLASSCFVESSAGHLHNMLDNLFANASESMEGAGTIHVTSQATAEGVCLSVTDEGGGFEPSTMSAVTDPYFTTKGPGHSGLGLSVVAGIMDRSGGSLRIESDDGGATVHCIFPAKEEPLIVRQKVPSRPAGKRGKESLKALVVDDEDTLRMLLEIQLSRMGFEVVSAGDGVEAMETFTEDPDSFDILLSDVLMPRMDGPELVSRVLEHRPDLPVLMITAYSGGRLRKQPWYTADLPLLTKPFDLDNLRAKVMSLVHA